MSSGSSGWKVIGFDTFSSEEYGLGECVDESTAQQLAYTKLNALEETQPTATSGGQWPWGIQDRVFIERPDGSRYRVFPPVIGPVLQEVTDVVSHDKDGFNFEMKCGHEVWTPTQPPRVGEYAYCAQCLTEWIDSMKGKG